MADPLSISASIIAILQLTGTVVQYLRDIEGASEDRQTVLNEVSSNSGVLSLLKELADRLSLDDDWFITIKSLYGPGGALEKYEVMLQRLAAKLKPAEGMKKLGKSLIWPFQKGEIREILNSMQRQHNLFNLALQNDHIGLSLAIKSDISSLHIKFDEVNQGLAQIQINQTDQKSHHQDQYFRDILAWLSPLDFPALQSDLIRRRQEGTGTWLLDSVEFKQWFSGSRETLFCPGIPGAGKTILASIVVDYLCNIRTKDIGIAYIYCTYRNRLEQTPIRLLSSLLKQLLQDRRSIPEDLKKLYQHHIATKTFPGVGEISKLLHSQIGTYSKVFIIVDALDECADEDGTLKALLSELKKLQTINIMNLMVTSRHIPKIMQAFKQAIKIEIRASDEDVQRYLRGQIHGLAGCVAKNPNLQESIIREIVKVVDGMFLLAQLHLDSLKDKTSPKAIRKTLETLPKGSGALDEAYNEALERISNQKPGFKQLAEQVLSWITYSARPLTILELQHAIAVEPGESDMDEENLTDVDDLVCFCAGLVTIDHHSSIVRLVHYTTQGYLERVLPARYPDAKKDITITCLSYLLFDVFKHGICLDESAFKSRLQQYHLLDYAAQHWGNYSVVHTQPSVQNLALKFLMDGYRSAASYQVVLNKRWREPYLYLQDSPKQLSGLHLVSYLGLKQFVELMLEEGLKLESKDDLDERTPLSWAVLSKNEAMVALLLEKGANLDSKDWSGQTPLSLVATRDQMVIMALLIEKGAEIDSKDNSGRTPLSWAAWLGSDTAVTFLLEKGAEVDSKDDDERTPLSWAAWFGSDTTIVALLLEKGAEVDSKDNDGRTPLSWAVGIRRNTITAALLLEKGAEVDSKDNSGRTPLSWAVDEGKEGIAALLLAKGARPDNIDILGETPL